MKDLINLINIPLYWISFFIPKNKNIWVFGAWFGQKYSDNTKFFFEYVSKKDPNITAVWLTSNKQIYKHLKKNGYKVCMRYGIMGYLYTMRAGYAFTTASVARDLNHYALSKKTKVIQLWHGIPLKKIRNDENGYYFRKKNTPIKFAFKELSRLLLAPFKSEKYHYIVSTAPNTHFETAFDVSSERIIITGYPRNDALFKIKEERITIKIIYMPTFRGANQSEIDFFSNFGFDIEKMNRFLEKNGMELYLKLHPVNKPKDDFKKEIEKSKFIHFLDTDDIYEVMYDMDILITDFSSIYIDFLLTDRPIVFTPFDKEGYLTKERELYYEYDEVTPGPKAYNWDEVLECLQEIVTQDKFCLEREKIKNKFHKYKDANSSQRLYGLLSAE